MNFLIFFLLVTTTFASDFDQNCPQIQRASVGKPDGSVDISIIKYENRLNFEYFYNETGCYLHASCSGLGLCYLSSQTEDNGSIFYTLNPESAELQKEDEVFVCETTLRWEQGGWGAVDNHNIPINSQFLCYVQKNLPEKELATIQEEKVDTAAFSLSMIVSETSESSTTMCNTQWDLVETTTPSIITTTEDASSSTDAQCVVDYTTDGYYTNDYSSTTTDNSKTSTQSSDISTTTEQYFDNDCCKVQKARVAPDNHAMEQYVYQPNLTFEYSKSESGCWVHISCSGYGLCFLQAPSFVSNIWLDTNPNTMTPLPSDQQVECKTSLRWETDGWGSVTLGSKITDSSFFCFVQNLEPIAPSTTVDPNATEESSTTEVPNSSSTQSSSTTSANASTSPSGPASSTSIPQVTTTHKNNLPVIALSISLGVAIIIIIALSIALICVIRKRSVSQSHNLPQTF